MRERRWILFGALVVGAVASVLFMKPVLLAPVAGDDRVWYPEIAALESWSVADELGQMPHRWEQRTRRGRVNVMTDLERRTAARVVVETSVGTGTPTYVVNGILKLLLAAVAALPVVLSVMSVAVTVCEPTVLRVTLTVRVPADNAVLAGSVALGSLEVTPTVWVLLTRFHRASTDRIVTLNELPAV